MTINKDAQGSPLRPKKSLLKRFQDYPFKSLYVMLLPATIITILFSYLPMTGILMAFQNYKPARGWVFDVRQTWVGLENFRYIFQMDDFKYALRNTLYISIFKLSLGLLVPVVVALLLNEVRHSGYKRSVQTIVYFPYFISWVIMSGILLDMLSPSNGVVNKIMGVFGMEKFFFMSNKTAFPWVVILSDVWKNYGFSMILFLAAITNIDPGLYEAAIVDGASIGKRMWHVTLPGIMPMVALTAVLSVGQLLNAGFEQVWNMLNDGVVDTGEIIDTLVYKLGVVSGSMYSLATAVGVFKSVVSTLLIGGSYYAVYKFADYKVF